MLFSYSAVFDPQIELFIWQEKVNITMVSEEIAAGGDENCNPNQNPKGLTEPGT